MYIASVDCDTNACPMEKDKKKTMRRKGIPTNWRSKRMENIGKEVITPSL